MVAHKESIRSGNYKCMWSSHRPWPIVGIPCEVTLALLQGFAPILPQWKAVFQRLRTCRAQCGMRCTSCLPGSGDCSGAVCLGSHRRHSVTLQTSESGVFRKETLRRKTEKETMKLPRPPPCRVNCQPPPSHFPHNLAEKSFPAQGPEEDACSAEKAHGRIPSSRKNFPSLLS